MHSKARLSKNNPPTIQSDKEAKKESSWSHWAGTERL